MDNSTSFDPFSQSFTLLLPDGTPFNVSIPELDYFIAYGMKTSIIYASALGASLLFVILLLLLTKADKRKSPIFIINAVALVINVIRDLLQCLYFTGPFSETYAYFAQDYSRVQTSDFANQFALAVLTVVVVVCVEASLMLQVRAVCITLRQLYQRLITAFSILVAGVAIAVRLALAVENCKYIISLAPPTPLQGLANAANITTTISISWFCAVFVTKLGFALNQKRKLGVARFGPMHIIFIMGCQTLIIPAFFSILQYIVPLPTMNSNVYSLVSIFMPLSSLWASASIDNRRRTSPNHGADRLQLKMQGASGSGLLIDDKFLKEQPDLSNTSASKSDDSNHRSPDDPHDKIFSFDLEAQVLPKSDSGEHGRMV